jgi:hypothetical protein
VLLIESEFSSLAKSTTIRIDGSQVTAKNSAASD